MRVEIVTSTERFFAIGPAWDELARRSSASPLSSHRFLSAWWKAFAGIDELRVLLAWSGDELVAVWPLYLRAARTAAFGARTVTPLGDLRAVDRTLLCAPGSEAAGAVLLARLLEHRDWDLFDVPLEPAPIAEAMSRVAEQAGFEVEREQVGHRALVELPPFRSPAWDELVRTKRPLRAVAGAAYAPAELDVEHAVDELHRLMRREWAERDQASTVVDPALLSFLKDVMPELTRKRQGHVGLVALAGVGAIAADVVLIDGDRHVQLLRGTDPAHAPSGATDQLTWSSLERAALVGATSFELADDNASIRTTRIPIEHMQVWNGTAVGRLHRGVASLRRRTTGTSRLGRMIDAIADAREPAKLVARFGNYKTLHLYRGELFTRETDQADALSLKIVGQQEVATMSDTERDVLVARLEMSAGYTAEKWRRGDIAVIASIEGRPAGIAWCARGRVLVPDIGRQIKPANGECYIHEVFVHPDDRGRKIAPAMLDHLARYLRGRDVYRAWALIERTNTASVRAFERADYVAVADVVYVQMGLGSHLFVRPPDPEARALLGV